MVLKIKGLHDYLVDNSSCGQFKGANDINKGFLKKNQNCTIKKKCIFKFLQ